MQAASKHPTALDEERPEVHALMCVRKVRRSVAGGLTIGALGCCCLLSPVIASAEASPDSDVSLAPVVVTATRTEAPVFDVPASVDRIDGDAMREGHTQVNISEGLAAVAGLVARDRQNYAQDVQVSVRGFGARTPFGIRGVRLFVDGIPATFPDGQGQITNVDLGSVDRIEVLRGPHSALYGNASGGVIQVFTEDGADTPSVGFGLAFGSDGQLRESSKVSGRSGTTGYVLSGSHFETDGYRVHSAARRDIANAKLTLDLDGTSSLTVIANTMALPLAQDPLGLTRQQYEADPRGVDPAALEFDTRKTVDQSQGGLIWSRRLSSSTGLRAMVYAGHRNTDQFQSIPASAQASALHPGGVIALSSDYNGGDLRWTWRGGEGGTVNIVAGLAVDALDQHRQGFQNFVGTAPNLVPGVQGTLRRDEDDRARNVDEYLQASWQFARSWSVSAGLRHSSVSINSKDAYIVGSNGDDSGSARFAKTLPVLGVMFALGRDVRLYASAGRGMETPTLNELAYRPNNILGLNFGLQPATSDSVEVGVKARSSSLGELNAALFDIHTDHEIVTFTNTAGRSVYQNAGATRRSGLELGWSRVMLPNLHAQVALTVLDATYRDAFFTCSGSPCSTSNQQLIASGKRMPGVAREAVYAALRWQPPLGWRASVDARGFSRVFVNDANSDAAPGYLTMGASLGHVARVGPWRLNGFVRADNLNERRYAGSIIVNEGNGRYFEPAPGRTWLAGVSAEVTF